MIIFLYGSDSYRRLQKQEEIFKAYRVRHSNLSWERFNLVEEEDFQKLKDFIANRSMFDPVKLAILENPFKTSYQKELKNIFKQNLETKDLIILIITEEGPPASFGFLIKKPSENQHFPALKGEKLIFFINKEAVRRGLRLPLDIASSLEQTFSGNTWGIITELDKMALMANCIKTVEKKPIRNYYELINILKRGKDIGRKLIALEIILSERRDEPMRVFNSLSYGLNKTELVELFADYDVAVKSGKLDYEEILLDFVLK